jgi:phage baseplate assembly protein gpV
VPEYPSDTPGEVIDHLNRMRAAGMITDQQCVSLAMAAAGVRKGGGQPGANVHEWRRGEPADAGALTPGTPVATFLNRDGSQSNRYAGGGSGTPGAHLDHAAVFQRYVRDASGAIKGMDVSEQYAGSGGMHTREYDFGSGWGEGDARNYAAIDLPNGERLGGSHVPGADALPGEIIEDRHHDSGGGSGQYLADRQKSKEAERIASSHSGIAHRGTAAGYDHHLAHLREVHDHISHLHARVSDLEARHERHHRKGTVTDVDAKKHLVRMEIGRDCDGGNQLKSPWLPYAQVAGGKGGLNVHSVPAMGEQVMLVNPDGSPDFSQGVIVRHGWYTTNPSPSTDPDTDVTVRGTTLNTRSMTAITHSIGGQLSGPLMSLISGGITRIIDKLGHHISAPNATVESSAETHSHTSTGMHTDTAVLGISHSATGQNASVSNSATGENGSISTVAGGRNGSISTVASGQLGIITMTASGQNGSIISTASGAFGAINSSAKTMQFSTPGSVVTFS